MTNFLFAQMPNGKGNISKKPPFHKYPSGGTSKVVVHGTQGAAKATGNVHAGGQKVQLSTPKCDYGNNDGYKNKDRNNFMK